MQGHPIKSRFLTPHSQSAVLLLKPARGSHLIGCSSHVKMTSAKGRTADWLWRAKKRDFIGWLSLAMLSYALKCPTWTWTTIPTDQKARSQTDARFVISTPNLTRKHVSHIDIAQIRRLDREIDARFIISTPEFYQKTCLALRHSLKIKKIDISINIDLLIDRIDKSIK